MFFLEGVVCWYPERAQLEYEARTRNWIWLDKFTCYAKIRNDDWNMHMILYIYLLFQLLLGNLHFIECVMFSHMLSWSYRSGLKVVMC